MNQGVQSLVCPAPVNVAQSACLGPDQHLLAVCITRSRQHQASPIFVSDGSDIMAHPCDDSAECGPRAPGLPLQQAAAPRACMHAPWMEGGSGGGGGGGDAAPAPIHLLAGSSGSLNTLVAAAASSTLRVFAALDAADDTALTAAGGGAEEPGGLPTVASLLTEPHGLKWRALAWHPQEPSVLAVVSQGCVCVCVCATGAGAVPAQPSTATQPVLSLLCMAEAPAGRCASPLISAAWVVEPTGVHDGSLAADSSHAHARGDAVLVVSWGADVRVLWWGAAAAAAAGEAGVQCFAQQPCSMDALHLGQQHQGPPRALATGPDGTLLATFDAPLGLSLGASSFGTDLTPSEPARALNGVAERQAGGGGDGGGGGGGAVVDLRGKHPGPECGPGSLAAAAKECDVGANGRSVSGREGGGLLGALLDGSALRGIGGAAGGIGAVCGGLVSVVGEPSDDAQPGGSGSASLGGGGDLKPDAAPLLRAMGALGLGQPKAVPTAFMLAGGGGGGGGRGGGAGAACLVQVRLLPLGGDGDGGREGGEGAPAHASTLLLLPRPDLLACLGDLIAVGSSVGAAGVQLFRCCASAPPTLRPTADGGTCTGTGACAASASTGAAATGRQLPLRLVPLAAAALGTPSLDASALRLRGLRLAWCEGTTAVSTSASASPSTTCSGGHPAEGHASTQAPTTRGGGQRVRLVALLGGCDRAGGPQLPSFMSRARGNGGGGGTPLSPLVLCTYQPAWLACAAMARPAVSARALADAGAVSGHVGGDAAGGDAAGVHALADAFAGMEARLMERLARMEVDARVAQRELSDRLSRMEDMLVAVLGLAGGPMWLEGGER